MAPPKMGTMEFHDPYIEFHFCSYIIGIVNIASQFVVATSGALGNIYWIDIDILQVIGKEHHICSMHESPTALGPFMRPLMLTTTIRM